VATFYVEDNAGNRSASVTRSYLIDDIAPRVLPPDIPPFFTRDPPAQFRYTAVDNVGLTTAFATLFYGSFSFRYDLAPLGGPFGPPFVATPFRTFSLGRVPRCVNHAKPRAIAVTVFDEAGLSGSEASVIPEGRVESCGTFSTFATSYTIAASPSIVSRSSGSTTLSVAIEVPTNTVAAPFPTVVFYANDGTGFRPIGNGVASIVATATNRTWTYSLVWDPSNATPLGNVGVMALMVDNDDAAAAVIGSVTITP
jgi:hypothetical protein